ncbi:MAG: hypothetical protein CM15mP65_02900 [Crocinitomicaceae bacterium]|nr:MAG: hypothetical protein CM15mP65_02900 [Crocinitomicaceae bacterium]
MMKGCESIPTDMLGLELKGSNPKLDVDGKIRIRDGANNGYIAVPNLMEPMT